MARSSFDRGTWRWLLQRVTAVFLIGVLAFHFVTLHFVNHAAEISFLGTQARMSQVGYFSLMWLFLVTATVHGVNGVYNALVNQGLSGRRKQAVKYALIFASLVVILQGIHTANAWAGIEILPW